MYMLIIGAVVRWLKGLFGGDGGGEAEAQSAAPPMSFADRMAMIREQATADARDEAGRRAMADQALSADGPLPADNVNLGSDRKLPLTFARGDAELVITHATDPVGGERAYHFPFSCLHGVAAGGTLRIDLHVPLPVWIDGQPTAVRSIFAEATDPEADARWGKLGSRNFLVRPTCPYCFKSALEVEPAGTEVPQPLQDGKPLTTANCAFCHNDFIFDFSGGGFVKTDDD